MHAVRESKDPKTEPREITAKNKGVSGGEMGKLSNPHDYLLAPWVFLGTPLWDLKGKTVTLLICQGARKPEKIKLSESPLM